MKHTTDFKAKLSRLMKMSWEIQKSKHSTRSKSLTAAWALFSNEDIAVYYLVRKLSGSRAATHKAVNQYSFFNQ